jgi:hypothetical protein
MAELFVREWSVVRDCDESDTTADSRKASREATPVWLSVSGRMSAAARAKVREMLQAFSGKRNIATLAATPVARVKEWGRERWPVFKLQLI